VASCERAVGPIDLKRVFVNSGSRCASFGAPLGCAGPRDGNFGFSQLLVGWLAGWRGPRPRGVGGRWCAGSVQPSCHFGTTFGALLKSEVIWSLLTADSSQTDPFFGRFSCMQKFESSNYPIYTKTCSKYPLGGILTLNVAKNRLQKSFSVVEQSPFQNLPKLAPY